MNAPTRILDSLYSLLTGLGGSRDKGRAASYVVNELTQDQLEAAFRSDWVARKIVSVPPQDATRQWRAWQAEDDQIEKIEELERAMRIQSKVARWMQLGRLYGGSALIIGADSGEMAEPLDPEKVKQDSLKFVHVVSRHELTTGLLIEDLASPWYGEPEYYENHPRDGGNVLRIHPSRVVRHEGCELPRRDLSTGGGWGDSVLQSVDDAVRAVGLVNGGIAHVISELKVDVYKIPDLSGALSTKESTDKLTRRFAYADNAKSVVNAIIMDKEEEWERIQMHFAGLPDLIQAYLLIASGAADIPATRLIGQSPAGMSATGESDMRNYYDRVGSDQNMTVRPALSRLDEVALRSALGRRDPAIHYEWNPLWQMDESQKADVATRKAQVFKVDFEAGLISPEALRKARENQLIEDGTYPGLEAALEEFPDQDLDMLAEEEQPLLLEGPRGEEEDVEEEDALVADAAPRTLYVRRDVLNADAIVTWARGQGFAETLKASDMHVTVAFSRQPVDWMKVGDDWNSDERGCLTVPPAARGWWSAWARLPYCCLTQRVCRGATSRSSRSARRGITPSTSRT